MSSRLTANRIIQAALSSAFALSTTLVLPAGALALTNDTSIINTGNDAEISSESEHKTDVDVSNTNVANISQLFTSDSNTGGNSADGNIGGGVGISTGNALSLATFEVDANHSMTGISGIGGNAGLSLLDIVNSGDDAEIDSELKSKLDVDVHNNNYATVDQTFMSSSNTGDNDADDNISQGGGVVIQTGDTRSEAELGVHVNKNNTALMLGNLSPAMSTGTLITNTGDDADVWTQAKAKTDIDVHNTNTASIFQNMSSWANTGDNSADDNIGGVLVDSGNATSLGTMNVDANHNMTGVGGAHAAAPNMNLLDIVNSGDDMEADSSLKTKVYMDAHNFNTLYSYSVMSSTSNTGGNDADDNIGSALPLFSGNAGSGGALATGGNHNQTIFGSVIDVMALWLLGSL